jgi:hypothetical protein
VYDEFDDLYDDVTRAVLDRSTGSAPRRRDVASGWRANAAAGAFTIMTATALGVQDVLEPKQETPVIEEIDVSTLRPRDDAPVAYFHVPGLPKASRAIVRPWRFA